MNYQTYANIAVEKISQYGGEVVIVRKEGEIYNPETNEYESEEVRIKGKGILSYYGSSFINGSTVQNGDVKIMCYFENGSPKAGDVITVGAKTYNVISIQECNPDGNCSIYYTIQGR